MTNIADVMGDIASLLKKRQKIDDRIHALIEAHGVSVPGFSGTSGQQAHQKARRDAIRIILDSKEHGASEHEVAKHSRALNECTQTERADILKSLSDEGLIRQVEVRSLSGRGKPRRPWLPTNLDNLDATYAGKSSPKSLAPQGIELNLDKQDMGIHPAAPAKKGVGASSLSRCIRKACDTMVLDLDESV